MCEAKELLPDDVALRYGPWSVLDAPYLVDVINAKDEVREVIVRKGCSVGYSTSLIDTPTVIMKGAAIPFTEVPSK
jgi:phage terminase large subunit GpA-like protein